jgi:hypothetical protein
MRKVARRIEIMISWPWVRAFQLACIAAQRASQSDELDLFTALVWQSGSASVASIARPPHVTSGPIMTTLRTNCLENFKSRLHLL